jgi:hypothetical protein
MRTCVHMDAVCVRACVRACMCVCVYALSTAPACTHALRHTHTHARARAHTHAHTHTSPSEQMCDILQAKGVLVLWGLSPNEIDRLLHELHPLQPAPDLTRSFSPGLHVSVSPTTVVLLSPHVLPFGSSDPRAVAVAARELGFGMPKPPTPNPKPLHLKPQTLGLPTQGHF